MDPVLQERNGNCKNISENIIGPHADKNSHTFAVTVYTNVNVITLPMKPLFISPSRLSYDYVFLLMLSVGEVYCCAD